MKKDVSNWRSVVTGSQRSSGARSLVLSSAAVVVASVSTAAVATPRGNRMRSCYIIFSFEE